MHQTKRPECSKYKKYVMFSIRAWARYLTLQKNIWNLQKEKYRNGWAQHDGQAGKLLCNRPDKIIAVLKKIEESGGFGKPKICWYKISIRVNLALKSLQLKRRMSEMLYQTNFKVKWPCFHHTMNMKLHFFVFFNFFRRDNE